MIIEWMIIEKEKGEWEKWHDKSVGDYSERKWEKKALRNYRQLDDYQEIKLIEDYKIHAGNGYSENNWIMCHFSITK